MSSGSVESVDFSRCYWKSQARALDAPDIIRARDLEIPRALRTLDTLEGHSENIKSIKSSQRKLSKRKALYSLGNPYMIPVVNKTILEKPSPTLEPRTTVLAEPGIPRWRPLFFRPGDGLQQETRSCLGTCRKRRPRRCHKHCKCNHHRSRSCPVRMTYMYRNPDECSECVYQIHFICFN